MTLSCFLPCIFYTPKVLFIRQLGHKTRKRKWRQRKSSNASVCFLFSQFLKRSFLFYLFLKNLSRHFNIYIYCIYVHKTEIVCRLKDRTSRTRCLHTESFWRAETMDDSITFSCQLSWRPMKIKDEDQEFQPPIQLVPPAKTSSKMWPQSNSCEII
jgi:hypothetical protein